MSFANAVFGSALILSFAILIASFKPAESQQRRADGYMIASGTSNSVWRVNTSTGAVSYCIRLNTSSSPDYVAQQQPFCSAESPTPRAQAAE